ncbi:MAG TPA: ribosome recycling factor [Elusimicrobia bacterium]|nr:ribosome recycling factor [Elusimicrobiota bacterium]
MDSKSKAEAAMKGRIEKLQADLSQIRTGRANPHLLDPVKVEYYGQPVPIKQVAAISAVGRSLEIRPFDPTALEGIEKAIQKAELGVVPQNDGKCLRINFPAMTEDRRKELGKQVSKIGEDSRVAVRGDRRDAIEAIRKEAKDANLPEDQKKGMEGGIQKLTDAYIAQVDKIVTEKVKELSQI